jgi:threonine synthase
LENGLIDKLPRLIAVQAEDCAPLLAMFWESLDAVPAIETRETIAEGVAIAAPVRGKEFVDIVRETGGKVLAVSDEEVESALIFLGRKGLYVEPISALPVAAYLKCPGEVTGAVVAPLTGHGLKANEKLLKIASS